MKKMSQCLVVTFLFLFACAKHPNPPPAKAAGTKPTSARVQATPSAKVLPNPNQALQPYRKGVDFLGQQKFELAESAFGEAQRIAPQLALPHYGLGLVYLRQNRAKDAIGAFTKAAALKPAFSQAYLGLGLAYRQAGDLRGAEKAYLAGIKYDGRQPDLHYNLGILYEVYLGQPEEALKQYQVYLSLAQKNADERVKTWVSLLQKK